MNRPCDLVPRFVAPFLAASRLTLTRRCQSTGLLLQAENAGAEDKWKLEIDIASLVKPGGQQETVLDLDLPKKASLFILIFFSFCSCVCVRASVFVKQEILC